MADIAKSLPLTPESVKAAHNLIKTHIHRTPVLTCKTLNRIASTPQDPKALIGTPFEGQTPAEPKISLFFKCENYQRIGAFKARGAHHAVLRLIEHMGIEEVRRRGVVTHSSGNHAQALALAASTFSIPAFIVMPTISTPSKIAGTKAYGAEVIFSGSMSEEREAVVEQVIARTGAVLIPPYDHPDIILGQGTAGLELEEQVRELVAKTPELSVHHHDTGSDGVSAASDIQAGVPGPLDAVITPLGGGGLLSGACTYFSSPSSSEQNHRTLVFGAEPTYQGADDGRRGLLADPPTRIPSVSTLTIADGLRTPVGVLPWTVISDRSRCAGVFAVSETQILAAMRLVLERMKVWIEPSAAVGLAVVLSDEGLRGLVPEGGWDVGVVFSGGNTTVEAVAGLFGENGREVEREEGRVGLDGRKAAENVAG